MAKKKKTEKKVDAVEKQPKKTEPKYIPPPATDPKLGVYTPEYLGWLKKFDKARFKSLEAQIKKHNLKVKEI